MPMPWGGIRAIGFSAAMPAWRSWRSAIRRRPSIISSGPDRSFLMIRRRCSRWASHIRRRRTTARRRMRSTPCARWNRIIRVSLQGRRTTEPEAVPQVATPGRSWQPDWSHRSNPSVKGFMRGRGYVRQQEIIMKRFRSSLLFLGLAALAAAQTPAGGRFESMKVHATEMPRFPAVLVARGVTNGLVQVVAKVDETGRLEDWLVVGYSQPLLADLAVEALKEWQFTPARFDGQPTTAQSQI